MSYTNNLMALDRLSKWFTPNRPIDLPEYLSGRVKLIYNIQDAVHTQGLHIILYGERGIGKTSLARVTAYRVQEPERKDGIRAILVSCDSNDDYSSIWRKVFQEIMLAQHQLGFAQHNAETIIGRLDIKEPIANPNDVRILLKSFTFQAVIIIDEFDRIPHQGNVRRLMADTIKLFSDTNVNATIIIVGVAESIGELISEHQSIARNISQILVEPMSNEELAEIIRKGYSNCNLSWESGIDYKIAALSQGYPHYAHLLGLWAGRKAIESNQKEVVQIDLDKAIREALSNTAGGIIQEYEMAVDSSQPDNLFKDVLLACALAERDSRGRFGIKFLKEPLRKILNKPNIRTVAYQSHLAKFCSSQRGPVLKRTGSRRNYRWQFINPQLIPYIKLEAIERGKLNSDGMINE